VISKLPRFNIRIRAQRSPLDLARPDVDGTSNPDEINQTLDSLGVPKDAMMVVGGAALVLAGIENRRANDVDILVPPPLWNELAQRKSIGGIPLTPIAPGKNSMEVDNSHLSPDGNRGIILGVELILATDEPPFHSDAAPPSPKTHNGHPYLSPREVAAYKKKHPHHDPCKAARDRRDIERVNRFYLPDDR
jgi:hypothetical protein